MTPLPKRRLSRARGRRRKEGQRKAVKNLSYTSLCPNCKKDKLPHQICSHCGYYKGKEVINVLVKLEKKERKQREKEIKEKEKTEKSDKKPLTLDQLSKKKF